MKTSFLRARPLYQKEKKGDRKKPALFPLLSSGRSAYNNNPDIVKETIA